MKNILKILTSVLSLILILSVVSTLGTFSVFSAEVEWQYVDYVEILGYRPAYSGENAKDNAAEIYLNNTSHVDLEVQWYTADKSGNAANEKYDAFVHGETYVMEVGIYTQKGYHFSTSLRLMIAEGFQVVFANSTSVVLSKTCVCTTLPKTIKEIHVTGFAAPIGGESTAEYAAKIKLTESKQASVTAVWTLAGTDEVPTTFYKGKAYTLTITISPNSGYTYDPNVAVYNCDNGMKLTSATMSAIVFKGTYECTAGATEPVKPQILLGDCNGDNKITVQDATAIQKHVAKLLTLNETSFTAADVTGDGALSVKDATMIQKYVAKLITSF